MDYISKEKQFVNAMVLFDISPHHSKHSGPTKKYMYTYNVIVLTTMVLKLTKRFQITRIHIW